MDILEQLRKLSISTERQEPLKQPIKLEESEGDPVELDESLESPGVDRDLLSLVAALRPYLDKRLWVLQRSGCRKSTVENAEMESRLKDWRNRVTGGSLEGFVFRLLYSKDRKFLRGIAIEEGNETYVEELRLIMDAYGLDQVLVGSELKFREKRHFWIKKNTPIIHRKN